MNRREAAGPLGGCVEVLAHIWGVNQMGWGAAPTARAKAKAAESEASSHRHILIH